MGIWFVPLSRVLDEHGLAALKPYAFATAALAALVSPLLFGAMADRHAGPVQVLRGLAVATALAMGLATSAIQHRWPPGLVLALIQLHALCSAPTWSLSTTIVFSRLQDARREFGSVRAMGTLGWMLGCLLVSALNADTSAVAGYAGAATWVAVAGFTLLLPNVSPPRTETRVTLRQRLGLDALTLLRQRDHRVVFVTAALFSIPLAAFYPFTPLHLRSLGLERTSAWMSLGQITEILTMVALPAVLGRWRLKWIFGTGLAVTVLRFGLCSVDTVPAVLTGIFLHGFSFTLFYITAQIYLEHRIDTGWRGRAQALMYFMNGGVGNLLGYLGTGWWLEACTHSFLTDWPRFWSWLAAGVALVLGFFIVAYRGQHGHLSR